MPQEHDLYGIFGSIDDVRRLYKERWHQIGSDLDKYYADEECFKQGVRDHIGRVKEKYFTASVRHMAAPDRFQWYATARETIDALTRCAAEPSTIAGA